MLNRDNLPDGIPDPKFQVGDAVYQSHEDCRRVVMAAWLGAGLIWNYLLSATQEEGKPLFLPAMERDNSTWRPELYLKSTEEYEHDLQNDLERQIDAATGELEVLESRLATLRRKTSKTDKPLPTRKRALRKLQRPATESEETCA